MKEKICFYFSFGSLLIVVASKYCIKNGVDSWKCNYIPADIPKGTLKVKLINLNSYESGIVQLNSSYFQSQNWGRVKHLQLRDTVKGNELYLMSMCFSGLKMLVELKILNNYVFKFDADVFLGLNNVKTLDVSGCTRLELKTMIPALNGSEKLPRLENLILSNLGTSGNPSVFDDSFTQALQSKNITHLDVSRSQIALFNMTSCMKDFKNLKVLNFSSSTVGDIYHKGNLVNDMLHLDLFDASHSVFPKAWMNTPFGKTVFSNFTVEDIDPRGHLDTVFAIGTINVSAAISKQSSVWIEKGRVNIKEPVHWHIKGIVARHNNVKRLDVAIQCDKYKVSNFEDLDIAHNGLEFIHPSILACMPHLSKVDFSYNQLFKMDQEAARSFEKLFKPLTHLHWVSLSTNNLENIPRLFFEKNLKLGNIDLSGNMLRHVTFKISHLKKLRILNLRKNQIKIVDDKSMDILNSIHQATNKRDSKTFLFLANNPISCSTCQTKRSLQWLTMTKLFNITAQSPTCVTEAGQEVNIDGDTVKLVQKICDRETTILSLSITAGVLVLIIFVSVLAVYKRRSYVQMMEKKGIVLQKLFEGQGYFEFVTFLSFCSEDEDFVDNYVFDQLNGNLRMMTRVDRNLVCIGDEYLRPGFLVLDETVRCMERASVMIAVVSNNYCDSPFCHNELDQAYRLNKPIILMLKGHVDEHLMMPTMKMLFKSNVRIPWSFKNGEYVMKTTWQNVCTSILDLVAHNL